LKMTSNIDLMTSELKTLQDEFNKKLNAIRELYVLSSQAIKVMPTLDGDIGFCVDLDSIKPKQATLPNK